MSRHHGGRRDAAGRARGSRRPRIRFDVATALVCALGLLFWARLIVVTDMPRTAVADEPPPDGVEAPGSDNDGGAPSEDEPDPPGRDASAGAERTDHSW